MIRVDELKRKWHRPIEEIGHKFWGNRNHYTSWRLPDTRNGQHLVTASDIPGRLYSHAPNIWRI